jgi:hypothetical protein
MRFCCYMRLGVRVRESRLMSCNQLILSLFIVSSGPAADRGADGLQRRGHRGHLQDQWVGDGDILASQHENGDIGRVMTTV